MATFPGAIIGTNGLPLIVTTNPTNAPSHTAQHNTANGEIIAIETTLGINPQGSYSTVAVAISSIGTAVVTAQSAATAAQTTATAAQTTATSALVLATAAQTTATTAIANALAAQTTANTAVTNASAAQTTANTAIANALAAQTTASAALAHCVIGQLTRATSASAGTQAVTTLAFKPKVVMFTMANNSAAANSFAWSNGSDDGTSPYCNFGDEDTGNSSAFSTTYSIMSFATGGNYYAANITTFATNGFTLTWAVVGTPQSYTLGIGYVAIG